MNNASHPLANAKHAYLSILCLLTVWFLIQLAYTPRTSKTDSNTGFDALQAEQTLKLLLAEQQPHPTDSPANNLVLKRIKNLLENYGYRPIIQKTISCEDSSYGNNRCAKVRNIIAVKSGSTQQKGLLLAAHYDSTEAGPGINDDGIGVAVLLEIARISANYDNKRPIVFLFTEGEEVGLLGARAFMDKHPLAETINEVINIEARGSDGPSLMFETNNNNQSIVRLFAEHAQQPVSSSVFFEIYKRLSHITDFTIFKRAGLQGLNFAHIENPQHYHTNRDSFDNLNTDTLAHHGHTAARLTKYLSHSDHALAPSSVNLVYTDIAGLFVIMWKESTSIIISGILLLACLCWMIFRIRQKALTPKQIWAIFCFDIIQIILAMVLAAVGIQLLQLLANDHFLWASRQWPALLLLTALCIWISLPFFKKQQQKYNNNNYLLHTLLLYALLSLLTSIYIPGISYLFLIPGITILIVLIISKVFKTSHPLLTMYLPFIVSIIPSIQLIQLLITANGFTYSPVYALLLILGLCLLKPAFSQHRALRQSTLVYLCLSIIVVSMTYTAAMPVYTDQHPKSQNLIHVNLTETDESFIGSYGRSQQPSFIVNNPGFRSIQGKIFPWHRNEYSYYRADVETTELPALQVKTSAVVNHTNQFQLDLSTQQVIRGYILYIPQSAGLQYIQLADQIINYTDDRKRNYYRFECFGQSCGQQALLLTLDKKPTEAIYLVTRYSGLSPDLRNHNERSNTAYYYGDNTQIVSSIQLH